MATGLWLGPDTLSLLRRGRTKGGVVGGEPAPSQGPPGGSASLGTTCSPLLETLILMVPTLVVPLDASGECSFPARAAARGGCGGPSRACDSGEGACSFAPRTIISRVGGQSCRQAA